MSNEKMKAIAKNQRRLVVASVVGTLSILGGTLVMVLGLV